MTTTTERPTIRRAPAAETIAQVIGWDRLDPTAGNAIKAGHRMLDHVLVELHALNIPTPDGVTRALAVGESIQRPPALDAYLAGHGDELDPGTIARLTAEHTAAITAADGGVSFEIKAHLLERAVEQLAMSLDDVVAQLRTLHWDAAAKVVAEATTAGLHPGMTAGEAIESDPLVKAWRKVGPVIPVLDQVASVYYRALLLCGFPVGVREEIPHGRDAWLALSAGGPVPLVLPSERGPVPASASWKPGQRSDIAMGWQSQAMPGTFGGRR